MVNKRAFPVVGLLLLLAGAIVIGVGAYQTPPMRVPPGAIVESPNARTSATDKPANPVTSDAPALPEGAEQVMYSEDFASGTDGWETARSAASWVADSNRLQVWGDSDGNSTSEPTLFINRAAKMGNGTLQASVYASGGDPVGLVFRGSDAGYYRLDLTPELPDTVSKARLTRVDGTTETRIGEATLADFTGYKVNAWQLVSVTAVGSQITVAVDGKTILEVSDSRYSEGWTGVWTVTGFGAQFDNVRLLQAASR